MKVYSERLPPLLPPSSVQGNWQLLSDTNSESGSRLHENMPF